MGEKSAQAGKRRPSVTSGVSLRPDGTLKDTPANRALHPEVVSQAAFEDPELVRDAFFADRQSILFKGQAPDVLRQLAKHQIRVDCIVTSPPYYGQRDYNVDGQFGLEAHPSQYLERLLEVFDLCREVLSETGSLWINIGDTYWSGKGAHKSGEKKQGARRFGKRPQDHPGDGLWARPKQLLLLPHRLAIGLQDQGWLVRNDNVWVKPNPVPDQVRDRSSMSHEYVFHFTRSRYYYYDREPVARRTAEGKILPPLDTWTVPPAAGDGSHKAAFSEELVRIPVLATTPPGGVVLDVFNGSGTTTAFARQHGLRSIGIDLNPEYCEQATARLLAVDKKETES